MKHVSAAIYIQIWDADPTLGADPCPTLEGMIHNFCKFKGFLSLQTEFST